MANIAFVGLGNMGAPMANNLIKAGHHLCVFDIDLKRMQAVSQAQAATSAHEAIVAADFIISMLPESRHVQALYLTDQKLLEHITPNAVVIDCSTISPATSRQVGPVLPPHAASLCSTHPCQAAPTVRPQAL